ncbi:MAG: FHA domain-containing protein [Nitrospinota bacterium]
MAKDKKGDSKGDKAEERDLESLLLEKDKLDSLIKRKFTKDITVLFTDITGSTQLSKNIGDIAMRSMLKKHYSMIKIAVEKFNGHLVKTMGDGTLSYFIAAEDGVKAAIEIQNAMHLLDLNARHRLNIRCGLNTGLGIVEDEDVYGDVVNIAQRLEALAEPLEALISSATYDLVKDIEEFNIVFLKETKIKGKAGIQKIYKIIWSPDGITEVPSSDSIVIYDPADEDSDSSGDTETKETPPLATLTVTQSGSPPTVHNIYNQPVIVGRSSKADIRISELFVSRKHIKIYRESDYFILEDLGSRVGSLYKNVRIKVKKLADGDIVSIGSVQLKFNLLEQKEDIEPSGVGGKSLAADEPTITLHASSLLTLLLRKNNQITASFSLSDEKIHIGRHADCEVQLKSPLVSRRHATIHLDKEKAIVEDLGSNNGVFVDGKRIKKATLVHGDSFRIGSFDLLVANPFKAMNNPDENPGLVKKLFSFLDKS